MPSLGSWHTHRRNTPTYTMGSTRIISSCLVQEALNQKGYCSQKIHLTPWDLTFLTVEPIQKGLLYFHNHTNQETQSPIQIINHLKSSFSTTLTFFPPLTGRFVITNHNHQDEYKTATCHILCNNQGALFVHAIAENTTVNDILQPKHVPSVVRSFFPLNGVQNHEGTSQPLFAVQVTELVDGVFIGCTLNHAVADGKSFWHFINSWAEISRGHNKPSKLPSLERAFLNGVEPPIRFPFTKDSELEKQKPPPPERFFHFTKEKILQLKLKVNDEAGTDKISSLQAVFAHLWHSVIRCSRGCDPQQELSYRFPVGARPRMVPPLPDDYFGNAAIVGGVTMTAEKLLEGGTAKCAFEMNKMIASYTDEMLRSHCASWVRGPTLLKLRNLANFNSLATGSSPWFDVYGNDFGWGKPVAVRSGGANKRNGKISVFAGVEEGSIDIEVCLPFEILEALENDPEFMDAVSI
ncbi:uncharacterized acetyltransferase At3g50280 [Arachis duranensis]|uniref:Uncharacterized acetyltransferase At3g50280 n=1 Tax=Arachis duranensis TaxID=130453 RepID=A0A6P4CX61_ARADU|nr:uncharacterized acetyltransferase At3g50280 [Arachis duranensis]